MKVTALFGSLLAVLCCTCAVQSQSIEWIRQIGTSNHDLSTGISADDLGNVYITGITYGNFDGPVGGDRDAFVSKFDAAGNRLWMKQLGTSMIDESLGISADSLGNVFITGVTHGSLGGPNAGFNDVFVSKLVSGGNLIWNQQFGTNLAEEGYGISADGLGNVYISGWTSGNLDGPNAGFSDAFVAMYGADGNLSWTRQLGTIAYDYSKGVSADGLGNVYISGWTQGNLGEIDAEGSDAFLSRFDAVGNLIWTQQLGTDDLDMSYGVSADSLGNVYISGVTNGNLDGSNIGAGDAFVSKYNYLGTLLWTRQLGTVENDGSWSVSADGRGNVFVSGHTDGNLGGPNAGSHDAFVTKYDTNGSLLWTTQIGTSVDDLIYGVSADGVDNVYISGQTEGSLRGETLGGLDAFVIKLKTVPEPGALLLAVIGCVVFIARGNR